MNTRIKNIHLNEKALLLIWLLTLATWLNTALVMAFSPFNILEVSALLFSVVLTQCAIYLTKHIAKQNKIVRTVYKSLFGE
ncbi:hypothetical protein [Pseudoalteromonas luteoviolacea]|uniref:Uncharacterized protein n=1 Tax=Pseudoalteromonas luteoviolacea DSM 6061 TaxID=1365250 RepID=A0A162B716_9GAMM|nr:hypothetical protein [Pseudoalteromonas luteoviolacea]KZN33947.1 hypothetical protein N475_19575 [Pseudoalteromonas luteoviolacea DSM 6061]KZN54001.1 hypothetical protein N474_18560 [Pseudoalteromonas luteoviolacea CPMOR-2]MBE0385823.1 hypothetical protein [Pseudoalteromonas luteoviolacea DSM 6061]TQF70748.1 hypothetical protein FLM44_06575 [Pseudoalteromonas luteoviolacea]